MPKWTHNSYLRWICLEKQSKIANVCGKWKPIIIYREKEKKLHKQYEYHIHNERVNIDADGLLL